MELTAVNRVSTNVPTGGPSRQIPGEMPATIRPMKRDGLYVRHGAGKAVTIAAVGLGTVTGIALGSRFGATVGGRIANSAALALIGGGVGLLGGTAAVGMTHKESRRTMLGATAIGAASVGILSAGFHGIARGGLIGAGVGAIGGLFVSGFAQNFTSKIWSE
jgi:hypothetical protein